jgi:uncharacterized protein (DUF427 family)
LATTVEDKCELIERGVARRAAAADDDLGAERRQLLRHDAKRAGGRAHDATLDSQIHSPEEGQMSTPTDRRVMQPDAKHPITIEPNPARVTVTVGGQVVADSTRTLTLREADYAPVSYFPPEDVDFEQLDATEHSSYCPYKGEANYYSVPAGGDRSRDAVWQYRDAYPAVAEISDHLAFYPDRVDSID